MIKKTFTLIAISILIVNQSQVLSPLACLSYNTRIPNQNEHSEHSSKSNCTCHDEFFLDMISTHEDALSPEEKEQLENLKEAFEDGMKLTPQQHDTLKSLIQTVEKSILGEDNYKTFHELLNKAKGTDKLTDEETSKLNEFLDMLKK